MNNPNDDDDRPDWEKVIRPRFTAAEDVDGKGARPSSLIPVHKLSAPDPLYDLQLMRALKIANEQIVRELGPLHSSGLSIPMCEIKTGSCDGAKAAPTIEEENEEMKLTQITLATALGATTTMAMCAASNPTDMAPIGKPQLGMASGAPASQARQMESGYRKSFAKCVDASNGVTVEMMNCGSDEFDYQDKRLNVTYQRLREVLPSDAWAALRNEQRKWLAGMAKACAVDEDMKGGTGEMVAVMGCELDRTVRRADELEALLKQYALKKSLAG